MVPNDQTPVRQTTQRHRRSDRYLQQEQAPVVPQSAPQRPAQSAPSSFQQAQQPAPQAYHQPAVQVQQPVSAPQHPAGHPQMRQAPARQNDYPTQRAPQAYQPPAQGYPQHHAAGDAQPAPQGYHQQAPQQPQGYHQQAPQQLATQQFSLQQFQQMQAQQGMNAQRPMGGAQQYHQGYQQQAPQQPGYGWEGAGQTAYYGQAQQGQGSWQQPYHAQQLSMFGMAAGAETALHDAPQQMPLPGGRPPRPGREFDTPDGKRPQRFPWHIVLAVAVAAVLLVGGIIGGRAAKQQQDVRSYVDAYDTLFCQGVYVDGIHLGGMTQQEGINAVTAQAQQRNSDWHVRLTYQGQTVVEINAADLGMRVDVAEVLREAWDQGHTGSDMYERQAAMQQLLEQPYYGYTAMPSGDTSVVDSVLEELRSKVYRAPQDAAIIEFDPQKTYPFTFQQEVPGRVLNTDSLRTRIYQMVSTMESGDLEIVPEEIAPNVTVAQLQQTVALRADEYTEISTSSTEDRNKNIARAFEKVTGTILAPGETFSFNGIVGKRTIENGFYPATEYAYGEETEGIGGGVCQASTTIYLAAVAANLEITKHTPHSMAVRYTTYGKDATVNMDGKQIDFCFRNNTDSNIYITAAVQTAANSSKRWVCRVRIYGPSLGEGVTYKLEAQEVETIPKPEEPEYRRDTKGKYVTYTDEEKMTSEGRDGHITESYCVKYVNGVEQSRTFLFRDVYNAAAPVIYRGVQERPLY